MKILQTSAMASSRFALDFEPVFDDQIFPFEPRYKSFLKILGFQHVAALSHGRSIDLGDGIEVTALPFYGEARDLLGFGANCYLVSRQDRQILVHADSGPDLDKTELCHCPPEYVTKLAAVAKSHLFVMYAEQGREGFLPQQKRSAYIPSISQYWRPLRAYTRELAKQKIQTVQACPRQKIRVPLKGPPVAEKK